MPHSQHRPNKTSSLGMSISAMVYGSRGDGVLLLLLHTGYFGVSSSDLVAFLAAVDARRTDALQNELCRVLN